MDGNVAVSAGIVYGGDRRSALRPGCGDRERWRATTLGHVYRIAADGVVYAGSDNGRLYAFDAATGGNAGTSRRGDKVRSSPVVVDGVVYFSSRDLNLYAIDAATGHELWRSNAANGYPAVVDGVVYVGAGDFNLAGTGDGYLYALADPAGNPATATVDR